MYNLSFGKELNRIVLVQATISIIIDGYYVIEEVSFDIPLGYQNIHQAQQVTPRQPYKDCLWYHVFG